MLPLLLLTACSIHDVKQRQLTHKFERHGVTEHFVELDSATVHYWRGENEAARPLLLLHGFGGDALFTWHPQLSFTEDHRIIAPDLLWFGASHAAPDALSLQVQIDAFLELLDHEGVEQADIVGISYGGMIASGIAMTHPERVDRLVIVDSPGPTYSDEQHAAMLERLDINEAADLVVPGSHKEVRQLIELAYHKPPPTPGFVLKDLYEKMFSTWVDEKVALLHEVEENREHLRSRPWTIPHRTLLVWGAEDILFPPEVGRDYLEAIGANASLHVIPETNHAPNIEGRREFNRVVGAFLAVEERASATRPGTR